MLQKKVSPFFKLIKKTLKFFCPKTSFHGVENLPDGPVVFVGNHCQIYSPLMCELDFVREHYTWCAGEMMKTSRVPKYAYKDFWSYKPKSVRWFYKILSYVIAPFASFIFNNANTVAVERDSGVISTFKHTVRLLNDGYSIVLFPEKYQAYNNIIYDFQDRFIDLARLYYKRSGKELTFVPMYVAPRLHGVYFGKAITYDSNGDSDLQRSIIKNFLMEEITKTARSLPKHTVVPYPNLPKKKYPLNTDFKEGDL